MARTRVDLPEKSGPSIVTKMPLRVLCGLAFQLGRGLAHGVTLRRRDVRLEETFLLRTGAAHSLGVPLDAEQPPLGEVPGLDRLDTPSVEWPVATSPSARTLDPLIDEELTFTNSRSMTSAM